MIRCKACGSCIFNIHKIESCDECEFNYAYDECEGAFIEDPQVIEKLGLERTMVHEEGECAYGTASGAGCYMMECVTCEYKWNLSMIGEY